MLKKSLVAAAAVAMVFGTAGLAEASPDLHIVQGAEVTIPPATGSFAGNAAATASCPAGETLTGGGANVTSGNSYTQNYKLVSSFPNGNQQWWAYATNMDPNTPGKLRAYAICAKVANVDVVTAP